MYHNYNISQREGGNAVRVFSIITSIYIMSLQKEGRLALFIVILGSIAVILDNMAYQGPAVQLSAHIIDFFIFFLFIFGAVFSLFLAKDKRVFIRRNSIEIFFALALAVLFFWGKYYHFFIDRFEGHDIPVDLIIAITLFNIVKVFFRVKKINYIVRKLSLHPAKTIMFSFLGVIILGTVLLMTPFATSDQSRMGFINALFTATSATCVTGLIVVDTATKFSAMGKLVIMSLIQVGGLGIMILAYFTTFLVGRKLSYEEKITVSYMLDPDESMDLARGVKNIVFFTFFFELCGALLLFPALKGTVGGWGKTGFFSVFHAVSAFCNAGFALFSDNLAQFKSSGFLNFVIAGLIIAGGISFSVLANSSRNIRTRVRKKFVDRTQQVEKLTLNTRIVLLTTVILIAAGTLIIYKFEHRSILPDSTKTQYLESFFQAVTLRTAGFNTMDISKLHIGTYALMMLFMFIGGASGSTAGGIKVNTLGVVWAYVKSVFNNRDEVVMLKHSIPKELINQAFLVMLMGGAVVFSGALCLTIFEHQKRFVEVVFECFSAFGTVGLSTGITPELTPPGKLIITLLMFIGRLGPLTIIAALAQKRGRYPIEYPEGRVSLG